MSVQRPLAAGVLAICCALVALAGCSSEGVQPEATVTCPPKTITVTVKNVSDTPARYTVHVELGSEGITEDEMYSTDTVDPGATAEVSDDIPDEEHTCRVTKIEVFDQ